MAEESDLSSVNRLAEPAAYRIDLVHQILDDAIICHVAFSTDDGPVAIPTIHARVGDTLYLRGSQMSLMVRSAVDVEVSVAATIVEGIVAARSTVDRSLSYRSVVVFGTPRLVTDPDERMVAFEAITNHAPPGRSNEARRPSEAQDTGRQLLAIDITEASATVS
jgi:nitroimidazol reductase NimA-like FMN-containing flavoprotein (pyridoxamine 5'-phosphate oxidase superfamily)